MSKPNVVMIGGLPYGTTLPGMSAPQRPELAPMNERAREVERTLVAALLRNDRPRPVAWEPAASPCWPWLEVPRD
jgi:hypothetical protein